jgi:hypothetical protein
MQMILNKHIFLITGLFFNLYVRFSHAQKLVPDNKIKAHEVTFITTKLGNEEMSVAHEGKVYHNKVPINRNPNMSLKMKNKSGILNAFTEVFSDKRLKQLIPEKRIMMTFYLNPSGQIMEVSFILNKNTLVTAQELEDLEKAIKANVSYKIMPSDYKEQDFIDIGMIIIYEKVLDRTLN